MRIKEIMSRPAVTCPVDSAADAPARLMWEFDCGVIPLVDNDGRVAGIITDRDLCMAALTQNKPLSEIRTASAMAAQVAVCHEDETVETAEATMRENQVRRVPVVDNDFRPIGVVSLNDLGRLAARAHRSAVDHEVIKTIAAVGQPRGHAVLTQPRPDGRAIITA